MDVARPLTYRELAELSVERIKGVGEKRKDALENFGISSVLDLLQTYPRRWVDRTNEARIADVVVGVDAMVLVEVRSVVSRRIKGNRVMVNVNTGDGTGRLSLTFFNQPWREKQLKAGAQIAVFGKPEMYRGYLQMTNPVVDLVGDRTGRIVPIYPQSEKSKLHSWDIAAWVESALNKCEPRGVADPMPTDLLQRLDLVDRLTALRGIHLPDAMPMRDMARRRLAFDEVFRVQTMLVGRKRALEHESKAVAHRITGSLINRFVASLPFPLTKAQKRVVEEITSDLAKPTPMHRLLQGDVGSGKTVVSVWTLLCAVQGGFQGALMAPTEVLAEQHHTSVSTLLDGLMVPDDANLFGDRPLQVRLLTNKVSGESRRAVLAGLADGTVDIVIGTHAFRKQLSSSI